jgi:hypothetical protein
LFDIVNNANLPAVGSGRRFAGVLATAANKPKPPVIWRQAVFRGVIAAASLKQDDDVGVADLLADGLPRRYRRGLIEA